MAECKAVVRTEVIEHHEGYTLFLNRREAMLVRWLLGLTANTTALKKRIARECKIGELGAISDLNNLRIVLDTAMKRAGQGVQACGLSYWGTSDDPTNRWSK